MFHMPVATTQPQSPIDPTPVLHSWTGVLFTKFCAFRSSNLPLLTATKEFYYNPIDPQDLFPRTEEHLHKCSCFQEHLCRCSSDSSHDCNGLIRLIKVCYLGQSYLRAQISQCSHLFVCCCIMLFSCKIVKKTKTKKMPNCSHQQGV